MLVSVLRDLHWTLTSLVSISSRTRRSRYLFTEESITIIPSALSLAHLRCGIQFRARVWLRMHERVWARFSAAAKGTLFTRKDRRKHSLLMHRRSIAAAKPRCSANLAVRRSTVGEHRIIDLILRRLQLYALGSLFRGQVSRAQPVH